MSLPITDFHGIEIFIEKTSKTMVLQRPPAGLAAVKKIQNDTILEKIEKIIC